MAGLLQCLPLVIARKKVALVSPPYHSGVMEAAGTWLSLAFVYIAGSLRDAGYDVEIYDAMSHAHGFDEIADRLQAMNPDVVATTAVTACINTCIRLCDLAKRINPCIVTVIGNVHATCMWEEILNTAASVDYVVRGEGEHTLPELLTCHVSAGDLSKVKGIAYRVDKRPVMTPPRPYIEGLDLLHPAWDLVDWNIYSYKPVRDSVLAVVSSSRGCNQRCSFCSQQLFWQRMWRGRSPESFVAELEHLNREYGVNVAMLSDETPTLNKARWERILDLLIERDLGIDLLIETRVADILRDAPMLDRYRKAGIVHIYVEVECLRQDTLNVFKKNMLMEDSKKAIDLINALDIVSETSFVLGMPDDTPETIDATLQLAKHYDPDIAHFVAIAPWPYAELYAMLDPYVETRDYSKYNLFDPVVRPLQMTTDEVRRELLRATKMFYIDKLRKLKHMSPHKRHFMRTAMKLLIGHPHLSKEIKGGIPPEAKAHLEETSLVSPIRIGQ